LSAIKYFIDRNTRKLALDEFLSHELNSAGYGGLEIRKMPMRTEVVIYSSRPGVVIGRRGSKVRELTYILETEFGIENIQIEVSEIENPWLNAQVMASRLARQLERGVRFRRMAYWILRRIMRAGALGCEIVVKGKLSSRRGRYQKFKQSTVAKTGEPADVFVDEADDKAVLKPGVTGIKVRIMKPDARLPGVVHVKEPKYREEPEPRLLKEPTEEEEAEEEEVVEEGLEGITDMDELRELEELDALELVEESEVEDSELEAERRETPPPEPKEASEENGEGEALSDEAPSVDLDELEELEDLDTEGEDE
jgi:small subunit ribosomal protein S3